jgi:uncharacterized tellurite resistance protein B-like protein
MDEVSKRNFKTVEELLKTLIAKIEEQEKRIKGFSDFAMTLDAKVNKMHATSLLLMHSNSGPTEK